MAEAQQDKAAKLLALQDLFRQQLPQRLAEIQAAWERYRAATEEPSHDADLYRLAHSLAGAAGTFGYRHLGERARELELRLKSPDADTLKVVPPLLAALHACAEQGPDMPHPGGVGIRERLRDESGEKLIYLLEDDPELGAEVARQLDNFGYRVEVFQDTESATQAQDRRKPDAWILDQGLQEGALEGSRFALRHKVGGPKEPPAIFISTQGEWAARLAAVRAGGRAYLTKPLDFTTLVDRLDRITGHGELTPYRILIVDDTELLARHYAEVLRTAGMKAEVLGNPAQLLEVIPDYKPELILMDLYMPECTGIEAARVIRQDPAYLNIPIVYLSTETNLEQQLAALRAGGDDFLQKPISDEHLLASVSIRVERFRALSALMVRDGLTGLLNHISLKLALESELGRAHRSNSMTSFAMIDIDHFKSVNDRYGHPMGDSVIKSLARLLVQRLRKSDIIGRYGGEEFAVVLRETDAAKARALLDELRASFAALTHVHGDQTFTASFSVGIATAPPHADMEALVAAADQALYQAKRGGRNRVVLDEGTASAGHRGG